MPKEVLPDFPEQNVLPTKFAFRRMQQRKEEEEKKANEDQVRKRSLDIIEGGQDSPPPPPSPGGDDSAPPAKKLLLFNYKLSVKDARAEYLASARRSNLNDTNISDYFGQEDVIYSFGAQTEHLMRLGYDMFNEKWKIYLKRENFGRNSYPSILGFLLDEMDSIIEYLRKTFALIDEGLTNGNPHVKPEITSGWKLEQPKDNIGFWHHNDCFYTESSHARARVIWQFGNIYMFHFNIIHEPGKEYPNYCGPKLRLSRKEAQAFINNYEEILQHTGPIQTIE